MGDQVDGSSSAARGAQEEITERPGFFARLFGTRDHEPQAFTPEADQAGAPPSHSNGTQFVGLSNLRRMRVDDVAIPKAEIVSVPVDIKERELVEVFRESGFTRLPVFTDTLDTPIGLVHLKDLALNHGFNGSSQRFNLRRMIRPLLYAPPSMPIGVLLQKMQSDRIHMALVIDEYGGVDGLVTIEDLIEQVIGEIEDEHDVAGAQAWIEEKPGCYLTRARAPLDEFESEIGMRLTHSVEDEEVDTLGGLVFLLSGRVPARGEVIRHPAGLEFEVIDADPRRIKRLRVHVPTRASAEG